MRFIGHRPPLKVLQNAHLPWASSQVAPHVERTTQVSRSLDRGEGPRFWLKPQQLSIGCHKALEIWLGVEIGPAAGSLLASVDGRSLLMIQVRS